MLLIHGLVETEHPPLDMHTILSMQRSTIGAYGYNKLERYPDRHIHVTIPTAPTIHKPLWPLTLVNTAVRRHQ